MWHCGVCTACTPVRGVSESEDSDDPRDQSFLLRSPYDDAYDWPNLYTEIDEMLELCILVFPYSIIRRLVNEKKLHRSKTACKVQLSAREVTSVILEQHGDVEDLLSMEDERKEHLFAGFIDVLKDRKMIQFTKTASVLSENISDSSFVKFGSEDGPTGLDFGVNVNHSRKRISLCFRGFRGSIIDSQWSLGKETYMLEEPNPMKRHSSQQHSIKLHNVAHNSMFSPSRNVKTGKIMSEYQKIMQDAIIPLIKEHAGYKLYVTGYGSGGALATIFALLAAAEPDSVVPKPVSCFSVGSPYVGDASFRSSHQLLEGLGKLRHLRVSNHMDFATLAPTVSFRWKLFDGDSYVGKGFKHVGVNMRLLRGDTGLDVSYAKVRSSIFLRTVDEITRGWENSVFSNLSWNPLDIVVFPNHTLQEYNHRVQECRAHMEIVTLNGLYTNTEVVGKLGSPK